MNIELPWPAKPLHPNYRSRSHWPKTRAIAKARRDAWIATTAALRSGQGWHCSTPNTFPVRTVFYPPTAHERDGDNLIAACKPFYDGIADGIGCDDKLFRHQEPIIAEPVKNGKVVICIGEAA